MPPQVFPQKLSRVHTQTFSHLYGRSSCRGPEGLAGGQGRLQGGPVALSWLPYLLSCPSYLPPSWVSPWELGHPPKRPFPLFRRGSAGRRKRGRSGRGAFRMCYLLRPRTGGEEPAPPFLCRGPGWGSASCGTCRDGAGELRGRAQVQGASFSSRSSHLP